MVLMCHENTLPFEDGRGFGLRNLKEWTWKKILQLIGRVDLYLRVSISDEASIWVCNESWGDMGIISTQYNSQTTIGELSIRGH